MSAYVLYFAGYHATITDFNLWSASAKSQKPDMTFDGYPWQWGEDSDGAVAANAFRSSGKLKQAVGTVKECATDLVYIVGHSSGCAVANALDAELKDVTNVRLVALDGYAPSPAQMARATTQVWAATCGDSVSRNHNALKKAVGSRLKVYPAKDCYDGWALHFSVVNSAATDKSVTSIKTGYAGCRANLMWLQP